MFYLWIIGAMFTDGLLDPLDKGGWREGLKRLFIWPWELGQFVRVYLDGGYFIGRGIENNTTGGH